MAKEYTIGTTEALEIIEDYGFPITLPTLIKWLRRYGLGKKIGGRWFIHKRKLKFYLENGMEE